MTGWPMSFIFSLECCEHKEGLVGPQIGELAFNWLRIPFCIPVLPPPPYYYHVQNHNPRKKQLEFLMV